MDKNGVIRDLCWPNVGYPNHTIDGGIRIGFWVDHHLSWLNSTDWELEQVTSPLVDYVETLAKSSQLNLFVKVQDSLSPPTAETQDFWTREVTVTNESHLSREIRVFQTHNLRIDESDIGDTAMIRQDESGVIHYKNGKFFEFSTDQKVDYACGVKAWEGMEGTWRDAEDGLLSKKPIEQGSVDSTIGITLTIGPNETQKVILTARFTNDLHLLPSQPDFRPSAPEPLTGNHLLDLSLRYAQAHCDHRGGIVAACDSDIMATARANYNYVWFRDGALTAHTMAVCGNPEVAQRFWEFFLACVKDQPYASQKYTVQQHLGASWLPSVINGEPVLPIQQDESALPIWLALKLNLQNGGSTIERFLNHMVSYVDQNGLPQPSWDLWEERRGVHFFTTATVLETLQLAALSDFPNKSKYAYAADQMLKAIRTHFWNPKNQCLARTLHPRPDGTYEKDESPDASNLLALMHGQLKNEQNWLASTALQVESHLQIQTHIGGVARYPGDYYFRRLDNYPGNPWVICTLWLARAKMLLEPQNCQAIYDRAMQWCAQRAEKSGVLAEQYHPETGEPLSVSPLTWSHAELLETDLLNQSLSNVDEVGSF